MYTPKSKEEADFLAAYDPNKYQNPAVAVDTALYGYDKIEKRLKTLLIKRGGFPYKGCLAFPGGFVNIDEHIHAAAARELEEETGISGAYSELYYTLGAPDRDPRYRVITPEYLSLVDLAKVHPQAADDAAFAGWYMLKNFSVEIVRGPGCTDENFTLILSGEEEITVRAERVTEYGEAVHRKFRVTQDGGMAFDHAKVAVLSLLRLQEGLKYGDIAYNVFPEGTGLDRLTELYSAAFLAGEDLKSNPTLIKRDGENYTFQR